MTVNCISVQLQCPKATLLNSATDVMGTLDACSMQKSCRLKADCMVVTVRTANVNIHHAAIADPAHPPIPHNTEVSSAATDVPLYAIAKVTLYRTWLLTACFAKPATQQIRTQGWGVMDSQTRRCVVKNSHNKKGVCMQGQNKDRGQLEKGLCCMGSQNKICAVISTKNKGCAVMPLLFQLGLLCSLRLLLQAQVIVTGHLGQHHLVLLSLGNLQQICRCVQNWSTSGKTTCVLLKTGKLTQCVR